VRLLRHLVHGAAGCIAFAAVLVPLPDETIAAANAADQSFRAARRKRGLRDSEGPPCTRARNEVAPGVEAVEAALDGGVGS
jgi:hypothetical protein